MTIRVDILPDAIMPQAYADEIRCALGQIPGLHWERSRKAYVGSSHALAAAAAALARDPNVRVRGHLERELHFASAPVSGLRPHQVSGVRWLAQKLAADSCALLADDMGLGKTAQAIRATEPQLATRPHRHDWCLVICPAIVTRHWLLEVAKWSWQALSLANVVTVRAANKRLCRRAELNVGGAEFRVISYDLFRRWHRHHALQNAAVIVADEAHYLANSRAKRTAALQNYMASQARRPKLILLTGTPLTTRPRDLHAILELAQPGAWGSYWQFTRRYCAGHYEEIPSTEQAHWVADGASNMAELRDRLEHVMLRRSKAEVGGLPPKIRQVIPVELSVRAQRSLAHAALEADRFSQLQAALDVTETAKLSTAVELAQQVLEQDGRPLLFTWRRDAARQIAAQLNCVCVTGDVASADRAAKLAGAHAAVATMASVSVGISLTQFDAVIFAGLHWVPSTLLQAENRPHRIGQTAPINVYYLIGLGSVDEVIQSRVIERLDLFDSAIGHSTDGNALRDTLRGDDDKLIAELLASLYGAT